VVLALKGIPPPFPPPDEREAVRHQLVAAAQRLQPLLEPAWQQYLALPAEVFTGQSLPPGGTFEPTLHRYQIVVSDARYRALSGHHEFQETHALLRRFAALDYHFTVPEQLGPAREERHNSFVPKKTNCSRTYEMAI
jgi:hypothetical protein